MLPDNKDIRAGKNPSFIDLPPCSKEQMGERVSRMLNKDPEFVAPVSVPEFPSIEGKTSEEVSVILTEYQAKLEAILNESTPSQLAFAFTTALTYELYDIWMALQMKNPTFKTDKKLRKAIKAEFANDPEVDNVIAWMFEHMTIDYQFMFVRTIISIHQLPLNIEVLRQSSQNRFAEIRDLFLD